MRLRLALCAAPLLAGIYFGWTLAASARRRRELIAAHISALEFIKAEISSRLTPLPDCAARLAAGGPRPLRGFYLALAAALDAPCGRDFASIWGSLLENMELPPDALAVLAELGRSLGRYDAQTQRDGHRARRGRAGAHTRLAPGARRLARPPARRPLRGGGGARGADTVLRRVDMEVDLVFKVAAVGILVAVLNILLSRSGREEQALMVTITGLVIVLVLVVRKISELFELIADLFSF